VVAFVVPDRRVGLTGAVAPKPPVKVPALLPILEDNAVAPEVCDAAWLASILETSDALALLAAFPSPSPPIDAAAAVLAPAAPFANFAASNLS
jgi:hypothetical protein